MSPDNSRPRSAVADSPDDDGARAALQRKVLMVLALGQILGGLGTGTTLALGALLIRSVSGSDGLTGMAATMNTLGAAVLAIPLARMAQRRGRRVSLSTGAIVAVIGSTVIIAATSLGILSLMLLGMGLMGAGTALNLQSRFAATDMAPQRTRARDLSLIVWSTTVGSVVGPNLFGPSESVGRALGMPEYTGGFLIALVAQTLGAVVYFVGLRPDPLKTALAWGRSVGNKPKATGGFGVLRTVPAARRAVLVVALSHAVMVGIMSMTPVHLATHGATLSLVGLTISLHIAGMYALSPVFGWLADQIGRPHTVLVGQFMLVASTVCIWFGSEHHGWVVTALILLGLGWSASTVAGSTMITESVELQDRPGLQGTSDLIMNLCGAAGGALAGLVMVSFGYTALALTASVLVLVVAVTAFRARRH